MAKKSWKNFLTTRPNAISFVSRVPSSLPSAMQFDKNKNKLPTPYGLFVEWANLNLANDWAAISIPKVGFALAVESVNDAKIIQSAFGTHGKSYKSPVGDKSIQCAYSVSHYVKLAKSLGYNL